MAPTRKLSPRAPSFALDDAIERASRIYEKERTHTIPADVAAQDMGYSGSRNGAALSAMATLRYYGLLERRDGSKMAITKEFQTYKFAPDEARRREMLITWVRKPPVFQDLLDKYKDGLPSDATLKFDLIQQGFSPQAADSCLAVFKKSVEFSDYFAQGGRGARSTEETGEDSQVDDLVSGGEAPTYATERPSAVPQEPMRASEHTLDRIPVRLSGGRKAWIEVPAPFYAIDKKRLKNQIDLLLTDDEEEEDSNDQ